jgi:hypothetical protein
VVFHSRAKSVHREDDCLGLDHRHLTSWNERVSSVTMNSRHSVGCFETTTPVVPCDTSLCATACFQLWRLQHAAGLPDLARDLQSG